MPLPGRDRGHQRCLRRSGRGVVLRGLARGRAARPALVDDAGLHEPERRPGGDHHQGHEDHQDPEPTGRTGRPAAPPRDGRDLVGVGVRRVGVAEELPLAVRHRPLDDGRGGRIRLEPSPRRLARPWPFFDLPRPELELRQLCGPAVPGGTPGSFRALHPVSVYQNRTSRGSIGTQGRRNWAPDPSHGSERTETGFSGPLARRGARG